MISDKLVRVALEPGGGYGDVKVVPQAAETWEVSPDAKTWTFRLRKGMKWENKPPVNGREVVAEDLIFMMERGMFDPSSIFQSRYEQVKKFTAPDKYTLVVELKEPHCCFLNQMLQEPNFILAPEIKKEGKDYRTFPISSGPMVSTKSEEGVIRSFRRRDDYWNAGQVHVDGLDYITIPDEKTISAALIAGQLHVAYGRDSSTNTGEAQRIIKANPSLASSQKPAAGASGIWLKQGNPKFDDIRVRLAISKAFNRQGMIDKLYAGFGGIPTVNSPLHGKWALPQEEIKKMDAFIYDPKRSKELLAEAGYPNGFEMTGIWWAQTGISQSRTEWIIRELEAIGIKLKLTGLPYQTALAKGFGGDFEDSYVGGTGDFFAPYDILVFVYHSTGARNGSVNIPALDKKIEDVVTTIDEEARRQKLLATMRYIFTDVLYKIPHAAAANISVWNPKLRNFKPAQGPYGIEQYIFGTWLGQ